MARSLRHPILAAVVALTFAACGSPDGSQPVHATASPAGASSAGSLDVYFPERIDSYRVFFVAPEQAEILEDDTEVFGLKSWVKAQRHAEVGRDPDLAAQINAVRTDGPDPDKSLRVAFYGAGSGNISDVREIEVEGEIVRVGKITNGQGSFDFAVWSPTPKTTVAFTTGLRGRVTEVTPELGIAAVIRNTR
jgi:hypothetical protein